MWPTETVDYVECRWCGKIVQVFTRLITYRQAYIDIQELNDDGSICILKCDFMYDEVPHENNYFAVVKYIKYSEIHLF